MHYIHSERAPKPHGQEGGPTQRLARRASVVAELHDRLVVAMWETETLLASIQQFDSPELQQIKHEKALSRLVELMYHFHGEYRFYISRQMRTLLDDLVREMHAHVDAFTENQALPDKGILGELSQIKLRSWVRGWRSIKYQVAVASQALENEFRSLTQAEPIPVLDDAVSLQNELFAFPAARVWSNRASAVDMPTTVGPLAA